MRTKFTWMLLMVAGVLILSSCGRSNDCVYGTEPACGTSNYGSASGTNQYGSGNDPYGGSYYGGQQQGSGNGYNQGNSGYSQQGGYANQYGNGY